MLIRFTIDTVGNVTNVYVAEGVSKELDKEAIRVISTSPKWTPGYKHGKTVPVSFLFPVNFVLPADYKYENPWESRRNNRLNNTNRNN